MFNDNVFTSAKNLTITPVSTYLSGQLLCILFHSSNPLPTPFHEGGKGGLTF